MRYFNALTGCLVAICLVMPAIADDQPVLTVKRSSDHDRIYIGDQLFAGFAWQDRQPIVYPIIGPTGAHMTRRYPMEHGVEGEAKDHPHHRSMWFAHGRVNNIDFWHYNGKSGKFKREIDPLAQPPKSSEKPVFNDLCLWTDRDRKPIANVKTECAFEVLSDQSRVIDFQTNISPADGIESLLFGDTKEGTMAIRLAPQLRLKGEVATGQAINSEGVKDKAVWGKRAKWVAYWGEIDGKTCGVAIFDHPTNLRHPTWWHARDYGLVAANPFGISDFEKKEKGTGDYTIKAGEALALRYRFVFFAGTAEEADIAGKYDQWVKETTKAQ